MANNTVVTPAQIEKRLYDLSKEIDDQHAYANQIEKSYFDTKALYEVALAKSRMKFASISSPTGKNYTVQEREDLALIENEDLHFQMASLEASVRSVRANAARIKTQVDIARSIGTSVRTSLEI
jgi:hypothetical protein